MSKLGGDPSSGISSGDVLIPTERHPACRRREALLLSESGVGQRPPRLRVPETFDRCPQVLQFQPCWRSIECQTSQTGRRACAGAATIASLIDLSTRTTSGT